MIKRLDMIEFTEFVIPPNKGINDVKEDDFERVTMKKPPNNRELMDKINEIIDVVNSNFTRIGTIMELNCLENYIIIVTKQGGK